VRIHTGRKHQIRRHLSGLGFPIVGDRLYGSTRLQGDLQLRSVQIKFISPLDGEEKNYVLPEIETS
jgi:tRNA pseudouridine32 synthase/23S rRNA pseudouridine746 synthase